MKPLALLLLLTLTAAAEVGRYTVTAVKFPVTVERSSGTVESAILLDTVTGKTWILTASTTTGILWKPVYLLEFEPAQTNAPLYDLFNPKKP